MCFCRNPRSLPKTWPHAPRSAWGSSLWWTNLIWVLFDGACKTIPFYNNCFQAKWQCCQGPKHAQLIASLPALPATLTASELWIRIREEQERVEQSPWKHHWPALSHLLPSPASHFSPLHVPGVVKKPQKQRVDHPEVDEREYSQTASCKDSCHKLPTRLDISPTVLEIEW